MNTGDTDIGIPLFGAERSAFFQQVAVNAEAVSNHWNFNAYALLPIGDTEKISTSFTKVEHSTPTGLMLAISLLLS